MTEEEWQRKMDFIVEHQAQFTAGIQQLKEQLKETREQSDARMAKIEDVILRLANQTENRVTAFDERMNRLAEEQAKTQARLAELAEIGAETDIRLNNLMTVIERHIDEGRNGKS